MNDASEPLKGNESLIEPGYIDGACTGGVARKGRTGMEHEMDGCQHRGKMGIDIAQTPWVEE
jgi:hypothetical protein